MGTIVYLPANTHSWIFTTGGLCIAVLGLNALSDPRARVHGWLAIGCGLLGTVLLGVHAHIVQSSFQAQSGAPEQARVVVSAPAVTTLPTAFVTPPARQPNETALGAASGALAVRSAMFLSLQAVRNQLNSYRAADGAWPALAMDSDGMISISSGASAGVVIGYAPANVEFLYSGSSDNLEFSARLVSTKYPSESVVISSESASPQFG